ncbi:MAG: hypothetical protein ACOY5C_02900 [Pseudomonadota bacterium]
MATQQTLPLEATDPELAQLYRQYQRCHSLAARMSFARALELVPVKKTLAAMARLEEQKGKQA